MHETRIRGWLLVLCALLLAAAPLLFAYTASRLIAAIGLRGPGFAAIVVARLFAVSFGIAAGLALVRRRPAAVMIAQSALAVSAAVDLLTYLTPFFPRNIPSSDVTLLLCAALTNDAIWFVYLARSRRVRQTYGDRA
jgi:hypothetical protein